jgi:hypothetical protein
VLTSESKEEPVSLPPPVLSKLTLDDMADGACFQVGSLSDGVIHLDWSGTICRQGMSLYGEADHTWTRKYWYEPSGLEQYLDLVRRSVETRQRTHGDVAVTCQDDDGAYVVLRLRVNTPARAWKRVVSQFDFRPRREGSVPISPMSGKLPLWGSLRTR